MTEKKHILVIEDDSQKVLSLRLWSERTTLDYEIVLHWFGHNYGHMAPESQKQVLDDLRQYVNEELEGLDISLIIQDSTLSFEGELNAREQKYEQSDGIACVRLCRELGMSAPAVLYTSNPVPIKGEAEKLGIAGNLGGLLWSSGESLIEEILENPTRCEVKPE